MDHSFRSGGYVGAFAFREQTRDQLWTTFENGSALRVRNAGGVGVQGLGFTVRRGFGSAWSPASVTYTFGRGSRLSGPAFGSRAAALGFTEAAFHDLVARLETFIGLDRHSGGGGVPRECPLRGRRANALPSLEGTATSTRFDVQVTQGLPFLQPLTRADWELLVAVSNLFYEASEGGFLDELAVQDPPTRVVGGISVRF